MLNIQKAFFKVSDFISWQKSKTLVLSPRFQRRAVWKSGAKSYLIDTIVRGLPIPIIFLRDRRKGDNSLETYREVIDGQQRLRTVISYVAPGLLADYRPLVDDFTVSKSHNSTLAGLKFDELDIDSKQAILDYEFSVHVLPSSVDDRQIIQIFRRMNSTSYSLSPQELRNAEYYGAFKSLAYRLGEQQLPRWTGWNIFSDNDISRMVEIEQTSEFLLLIINKGILFSKGSAILNNVYKKYDESLPNQDEIEMRFLRVMDVINDVFSPKDPDFILCKKTTIYALFASVYHLLYKQVLDLSKTSGVRTLEENNVNWIKLCNDRIRERSAPNTVLEALSRRTTNIKERKSLFEYLTGSERSAKPS